MDIARDNCDALTLLFAPLKERHEQTRALSTGEGDVAAIQLLPEAFKPAVVVYPQSTSTTSALAVSGVPAVASTTEMTCTALPAPEWVYGPKVSAVPLNA